MNSRLARERVMGDLRTLASDAEALLRATAGDVSEKAKETRERLTKAIQNAKATCEEFQTRGFESAKEAVKNTDETIRAHPYESIGVAFIVGLAAGWLLKRK